jgi:hypothetical protein
MPGILVRPDGMGTARRWNSGKSMWTLNSSASKPAMRSVAVTSFRRNAFRFSSPFVQAQILEPVDADIQTEAGGELSYIRATKLLQYTRST